MRNTSIFVASAVLAVAPANMAFAHDFNGPYAGVQGDWVATELHNPWTDLGALALDDDRQSFTGGAVIGYDHQVAPGIVLGAEAGMDFFIYDVVDSTSGPSFLSIDPNWSIDLSTRAGYLLDLSTLAYVRGGYTNAHGEMTATSGTTWLTANENRDGWLLGAGIERLFLRNISGRLEYRYSDLTERDGVYDRYRVLAGIAYRF